MTKNEFFTQLRKKLCGLPSQDVEDRISFYNEMIEDRIEEGKSEEEAVFEIGSVDEISAQIINSTPLTKIAKEKIKPKRGLRAWEILLLIVGAPLWLSLLVAVIAVVFSFYAVLWSLVISVGAIFVSLIVCVGYFIFAGITYFILGKGLMGFAFIGLGLVCAGGGILAYYSCKLVAKAVVWITKKVVFAIKKAFIGKEN